MLRWLVDKSGGQQKDVAHPTLAFTFSAIFPIFSVTDSGFVDYD